MTGIMKEKLTGDCLDVDSEGKSQIHTWVSGRQCSGPGKRRGRSGRTVVSRPKKTQWRRLFGGEGAGICKWMGYAEASGKVTGLGCSTHQM